MKKLLLLLLLGVTSFAYGNNVSVISGSWDRGNAESVKLFKIENGTLTEIATSIINPDKTFYFAFAPKQEDFYVIGTEEKSLRNKYTFYFKPGDQLNVAIDAVSYKLTGENTKENVEMARWHDWIFPLEDKSIYFMGKNSTHVDFFPILEEKVAGLNNYKLNYTKNNEFVTAFNRMQRSDMAVIALNFIYTPRTAHPEQKDFPEYYNTLNIASLTKNTDLLHHPYGNAILRIVIMREMNMYTAKNPEEGTYNLKNTMNYILPQIGDELMKSQVVANNIDGLKNYNVYLEFEQNYGKYLLTAVHKDALKKKRDDLIKETEVQPTVDFKFRDMEDKPVALSDFKGKVVYVDVWATWCGPCKGEIPHLKKIEGEYHDKDVVFLAVSIDTEKNHANWKKFVQDEELKGVQLFAGDQSKDISGPYDITGIPRFMLFGKDGKIISAKAPRPSSGDELKKMLDQALTK